MAVSADVRENEKASSNTAACDDKQRAAWPNAFFEMVFQQYPRVAFGDPNHFNQDKFYRAISEIGMLCAAVVGTGVRRIFLEIPGEFQGAVDDFMSGLITKDDLRHFFNEEYKGSCWMDERQVQVFSDAMAQLVSVAKLEGVDVHFIDEKSKALENPEHAEAKSLNCRMLNLRHRRDSDAYQQFVESLTDRQKSKINAFLGDLMSGRVAINEAMRHKLKTTGKPGDRELLVVGAFHVGASTPGTLANLAVPITIYAEPSDHQGAVLGIYDYFPSERRAQMTPWGIGIGYPSPPAP